MGYLFVHLCDVIDLLNVKKSEKMKKLVLIAMIMSCMATITMAQTHPSKKTTPATTKTEVKKDSAGAATASTMNKHKGAHRKGAHKKA